MKAPKTETQMKALVARIIQTMLLVGSVAFGAIALLNHSEAALTNGVVFLVGSMVIGALR